jgi:Na+/proline symporter
MVIVEAIAVSTMVCNDLVMPLLLRTRRFGARAARDLTGLLLASAAARSWAAAAGLLYFRIAGEAYALVSIGLISFAAVAQFAPALLGGMYWKRRHPRTARWPGCWPGFALWAYTLMLPSIAKSGWIDASFLQHGPWGIGLLKPEQLLGLTGWTT